MITHLIISLVGAGEWIGVDGGRTEGQAGAVFSGQKSRSWSLFSSSVLLWESVGESVRGRRLGTLAKIMVQLVLFP